MAIRITSRDGFGIALALLLLITGLLSPFTTQSAQGWPAGTCADEAYWLEFTGLQFCIDKERVTHLNHLNLDSPSAALRLTSENSETEIGLSRLTDEQVTGGLHTHLGVGVRDIFELLLSGKSSTDDAQLAKRIMNADEQATLRHFKGGEMEAYAIIRRPGNYSSVYLLLQSRNGAVKLAGDFDADFVEHLLSHIRRAP